jgi:hypothetical protein
MGVAVACALDGVAEDIHLFNEKLREWEDSRGCLP